MLTAQSFASRHWHTHTMISFDDDSISSIFSNFLSLLGLWILECLKKSPINCIEQKDTIFFYRDKAKVSKMCENDRNMHRARWEERVDGAREEEFMGTDCNPPLPGSVLLHCALTCVLHLHSLYFIQIPTHHHWWVCSHVLLHCNATRVGVMHILQTTSGQGTLTSYFKSLLPSIIVWTLCSHFQATEAREYMCNATPSASYLYKCNIVSSSSQSVEKPRLFSTQAAKQAVQCSLDFTARCLKQDASLDFNLVCGQCILYMPGSSGELYQTLAITARTPLLLSRIS